MRRAVYLTLLALTLLPFEASATDYYVRLTVGDDKNDGLSAETAWKSINKLGRAMVAGDTAYVGPGLYRDQITVMNSGEIGKRITFIADSAGQHTGDPPGVVMITGAEPMDESVFQPSSEPGVYQWTPDIRDPILSIAEMDGDQFRYDRARDTMTHLREGLSERETVVKRPKCWFYDKEANVLYIHTSDGKAPDTHEIEIVRRGNGIAMTGKHFISVIGFTIRHVGDAGINFFKGSGDGVAINNTSWGSRQGVRVYNATNVLVYGNTLFRNENSGVYFAAESFNGAAIANTNYENIKGVRWSSDSFGALAIDNILFDNYEAGIAIENVNGAVLRGNTMVNNEKAQLLVMRTEYSSEGNCFKTGSPEQLTADFVFTEHYKTLEEYQQEKHRDLYSQADRCGELPKKVDVHKLHEDARGYAKRARRLLTVLPKKPGASTEPSPAAKEPAKKPAD
jgi:parallel beta-helix repeat protein